MQNIRLQGKYFFSKSGPLCKEGFTLPLLQVFALPFFKKASGVLGATPL
jgi:hypothetical protein